jgi:hypothetical protein
MTPPAEEPTSPLVRRHLRFGWWSLLTFATLGLALEGMLGFKVGWYVDVSNETRRLMWTLAHAHGVLLALVHIGFAATDRLRAADGARRRAYASPCLTAAALLIPGGFFLGGLFIHAGDPGLGVLLVPTGALLLLAAILLTAL